MKCVKTLSQVFAYSLYLFAVDTRPSQIGGWKCQVSAAAPIITSPIRPLTIIRVRSLTQCNSKSKSLSHLLHRQQAQTVYFLNSFASFLHQYFHKSSVIGNQSVLTSLNYRFQAAVNLELLEDVSDVVPRRGGADEE